MWSMYYQHHLGSCLKCRTSSPAPDLSQNIQVYNIPRWYVCPLKLEEHWLRQDLGDESKSDSLGEEIMRSIPWLGREGKRSVISQNTETLWNFTFKKELFGGTVRDETGLINLGHVIHGPWFQAKRFCPYSSSGLISLYTVLYKLQFST